MLHRRWNGVGCRLVGQASITGLMETPEDEKAPDEEAKLLALERVIQALEPLNDSARARVISAVCVWYGLRVHHLRIE